MKIKANHKISRLGANSKLFTGSEYSRLRRGKVVDLKEESANKLINYGLAEKANTPKPKKVKEKK